MRRYLILAGVACIALTGRVAGQAVTPLDGPEIAAIWKKRQDRIHSAVLDFTRIKFEPKGSIAKTNPHLIRAWKENHPGLGGGPFPPKDFRGATACTFSLDGLKVRHDYSTHAFDVVSREYRLTSESTAFDGMYFRNVHTDADGSKTGSVRRVATFPEPFLVGVSALFTSFRGVDKNLTSLDVRQCTPTGRRSRIEGFECLEYFVQDGSTKEAVRNVWLSPGQGWHIARDVVYIGKHDVVDKKELRYRQDPVAGWSPATWEYARVERGELVLQVSFSVESCTFNETVDTKHFTIPFPPGMNVMDEDAQGGTAVGIVQEDGRLLPDDGRAAYYLPGDSGAAHYRVVLYVLALLIAVLLTWRLVRRVRGISHSQPSPLPPSGAQP